MAATLARVDPPQCARKLVPVGGPRTRRRYACRLRALLDAARADPQVVAFPYEGRRHLVGEEPTECRNGHHYRRGDGRYSTVERGWLSCCCGGHATYTCATYVAGNKCGDQQTDPWPSYDCDVEWPPPVRK